MSPRRMDISSLLRDPSPPSERPRTIDALLHHPHPPSGSLLAILNRPALPDSPTHRPLPAAHHPRPPFLGLDALVHVASEEHRRITAVSASSPDRDTESAVSPGRDSVHLPSPAVHDHDRPSRHYAYLPSPFQDNPRPHKRTRDAAPPSPSPDPRFPIVLTSPSMRHHPSASPTNNYSTLRRQSTESTRSPSALIAGPTHDGSTIPHSPSVSLPHASPFLHSLHPLPIHSSPRNNSPHRHSPQHLRPQHHSSPIQTGSFIPSDIDPMSPRHGHGPRMAGGIQVFSNDPSSTRELSRSDPLSYQSPGRDVSTEWLVSESRVEHARYEPSKLSPLSGRTFSPDDERHRVKALPNQVEGYESVFHRERIQSYSSHSSLVDAMTDNGKSTGIPTEADFPTQPFERHPIRVWEEPPPPRDPTRRVPPVHIPDMVHAPAEGRMWPETSHGERPVKDDREAELQQDVTKVPTPSLSTCKEPSPLHAQTLESLASDLRTPNEGIRPDPQSFLPTAMQFRSPVWSEPQALLPQASLLNSSAPHASASPVLDIHLKNFDTPSESRHERFDRQVDASTNAPLTTSDPTITEPLSGKVELIPEVIHTDDILMANPLPLQPSPGLTPSVPAKGPGSFGMSPHANVSQRTSRSPSPQPFPPVFLVKDEHNAPPDDKLISPPTHPEPPSHCSSEPKSTSEREPPVLEETLMDVDEELLSLVEDRPVRAIPAILEVQTESSLPLPSTAGQDNGAGADQGSTEAPDGSSQALSSQPALKGPFVTDEEKDRASMPPPAARNKKAEKDKITSTPGPATGSKKKKDGSSKPTAKPKQPSKPRAKPVPKPKARPNVADTFSKGSIPKGAVNVNARSRSTSVIPGAVDDVVPELEPDKSDKEDDKLYCVCKTRYDEDRMMIACDRCDEWFHTLCVNIPDLEIDLVDQFICPPCIHKHSHLRTTWKRRCLFGLQHENPSSPEACHRPSRGAFSKYCSDDCGIKYMRAHIAQWEKSGGVRGLLWESVKNAPKREGVVAYAETSGAGPPGMMDVDSSKPRSKLLDSAAKRRAEREVARLNIRLEVVVKEREFMKRELDMVIWRERVVALASERAGKAGECGWDQRLCFGEEEWADFGPEVLESYEEERVKVEPGDDAMSLDATSAAHGEWWCTGKKKCERHAGWQKLRAAEVSFDRETKEGILLKLTTREREIRKCIEDILYPQPTGTFQAPSEPSRAHPEVQLNGSEKLRPTSLVSERGKKRSS